MEMILEPILAELDHRVIIGAVALLLIVGVLALVKKVVKLGIVVIVIALAVSTLGPMAKSFQEDYKFSIEDGAIHMTISGAEYEISRESYKEIVIVNKGMGKYEVQAVSNDGELKVIVPSFMISKIQDFGDRYGIPVTLK